MMDSKRTPRLIIQAACFLLSLAVLWPVFRWSGSPKLLAQASAFTALCTVIAASGFSAGAAAGLIFALIAAVHHRWFCRYICPTGLLLEGAARIGPAKTSWWNRCPPINRYIVLATIAGALVGYPFLLWMDPLALFSSAFASKAADSVASLLLAGLGLFFLVLATWILGPVWCVRICPLGGTQELLTDVRSCFKKLNGNRKLQPWFARRAFLTVSAGLGLALLGRKAAAFNSKKDPLRPPGAVPEDRFRGLCIRCSNCIRACPSKIIHPDTGQAGIAGLLAPVIRYEKKYCLEDCCFCTQVCPSGALQALDLMQKKRYVIGEALVEGELCLLALGEKDCDACMRSCPFDAVRIHWDEERYVAYPVVNMKKCNGCGACEVVCPTEGIKAIRVWRK
jgi:formate hydrogenlyase subunit 6/NADH:ubiquinone oxidoreductase subunit I